MAEQATESFALYKIYLTQLQTPELFIDSLRQENLNITLFLDACVCIFLKKFKLPLLFARNMGTSCSVAEWCFQSTVVCVLHYEIISEFLVWLWGH